MKILGWRTEVSSIANGRRGDREGWHLYFLWLLHGEHWLWVEAAVVGREVRHREGQLMHARIVRWRLTRRLQWNNYLLLRRIPVTISGICSLFYSVLTGFCICIVDCIISAIGCCTTVSMYLSESSSRGRFKALVVFWKCDTSRQATVIYWII